MKIYLSYRRADGPVHAGRLADRLVAHFGTNAVFKDVADIPFGKDYRSVLREELEWADVVLVLIGPEWLRVDGEGRRRLDDPDDFVRIELEMALSLGMPVVPVLVNGASMPPAGALPVSLRALASRQAAELRPDPDYHLDSDRLIRGLEALVKGSPQRENFSDLALGESGPVTVFVSHSTQDRKWVEREIVALLSSNGIKPWYSKASISTASQWEREILRGMESCDWFLLVASPRAATSEWIKDELNWAVYNRPTRIVPVIMENCNLWNFHIRLPRIQNIDFTRDASTAKKELTAIFKGAA